MPGCGHLLQETEKRQLEFLSVACPFLGFVGPFFSVFGGQKGAWSSLPMFLAHFLWEPFATLEILEIFSMKRPLLK